MFTQVIHFKRTDPKPPRIGALSATARKKKNKWKKWIPPYKEKKKKKKALHLPAETSAVTDSLILMTRKNEGEKRKDVLALYVEHDAGLLPRTGLFRNM